MPLSTPDITPAQVIAALTSIVGLFVSQGAITNNTGKLVVGIASIVIPAIIAVADAIIRHGRAQVAAATILNVPQPAELPPDTGDAAAERKGDGSVRPDPGQAQH